MTDAITWTYLGALVVTAVVAFRNAPETLVRAYREDRVTDDAVYHVANTCSIVLLAGWVLAVLAGLDAALLPEASWVPAARLMGLYAAWIGLVVALRARWVLGAAFAPSAVLPADGAIVEEGPYSVVRHPFYLSLLFVFAMGAVALDSFATLAALAGLSGLVHVIAVREEAHLVEALGPAYEAYRARVPRWVPRWFVLG